MYSVAVVQTNNSRTIIHFYDEIVWAISIKCLGVAYSAEYTWSIHEAATYFCPSVIK
jgi:hypothetical protein